MSYRALKHLVGETSLERKCRYIIGGGILIVITASFYWFGSQSEKMVFEQNRQTCRLMVNPILVTQHWVALEAESEFRPIIKSIFGETVPDDLKNAKWRFISPPSIEDEKRLPQDEFEYHAFESFAKGESTDATRTLPGAAGYQYVAPLRLSTTCMSCHENLAPDSQINTKVGDVFRAVSITMPVERVNMAVQHNRGILIVTAIVTAFLAIVISYVMVHYVIVVPMKHLKDVSDAVGSGSVMN